MDCLLNPEKIKVDHSSGAETQRTFGAAQSGTPDPVQRISGGTTTLTLDLLFDVSLPQASGRVADVRALTEGLWELSQACGKELREKEKIRFMWGKSWNIAGDIKSLSENLEQFTQAGAPQRSWISMSFETATPPQAIRKESRRF